MTGNMSGGNGITNDTSGKPAAQMSRLSAPITDAVGFSGGAGIVSEDAGKKAAPMSKGSDGTKAMDKPKD